MAKDKFESQSGGTHLKEGHEESDLSIRGIVLFGVFLAVGGLLSFVLMYGMILYLEKLEREEAAKLTPMEQQLQKERDIPREGLGKDVPAREGQLKSPPDWYGRGKIEDHISRTFKSPRLQYNDEHDMALFLGSEEEWLNNTGKDPNGNIHIPIDHAIDVLAQRGLPQVSGAFLPANVGARTAAYPTGASDTGEPARNNTGGTKK
ncbi:MAG TPA: hypothetical protein VE133_02095 [Candidatus Sulfotelmatobacter sp.]|jgi:hypothetical protein|nr:hypothetical protein [Candidatus Sulfotelmatobacter sp.]